MKKSKEIIFLFALCGAGKSTYAKENFNPKTSNSYIIDLDSIMNSSKSEIDMLDSLFEELIEALEPSGYPEGYGADQIIIDGLFTTNSQIRKTIDFLIPKLNNYNVTWSLIWWEENRKSCLINDKQRGREQSAALSIKNLPFEIPDLKILKEINMKNVKKMQVKTKSPAEIWVSSLGFDNWTLEQTLRNMVFKGEEWSNGGTYGNCWNDSKSTSDPDQPLEFNSFDELLEKICPKISLMEYKKIKRECCQIKMTNDNDYYGGYSSSSHHECDMDKLYNVLVEMNYIKE